MALSNTAVPKYYGEFRDAVIRGEIPVCKEIEMEMNRIDDLIADPDVYYDDQAVEGFIKYCENELTLTDGSDLKLLDSFKIWAEQIFGWYEFEENRVRCKIYVWFLLAKFLSQCGCYNDSSDNNCTNNETGRRGLISDSNSYHQIQRSILQILD